MSVPKISRVSGEARAVALSGRPVEELLPLALSRPREALARARAVLAGRPTPYEASVAHQAAGIVLREFGDLEAGLRELRRALRLARGTRSPEREADVLATLGVGLIYAGRTAAGLAAFDQALRQASGALAGRILVRRGIAMYPLGRYSAALADLRQAVTVLRRADDPLWTARALNARAVMYLTLGSPSRADSDFGAAEELFARTGQELESVYMMHNRGRRRVLLRRPADGAGLFRPGRLRGTGRCTCRPRAHRGPVRGPAGGRAGHRRAGRGGAPRLVTSSRRGAGPRPGPSCC